MRFTIYQIDLDHDTKSTAFESIGMLEDRHLINKTGIPKIDASIYRRVYNSFDKRLNDLEDIYRTFNIDQPIDYKGRALSVSDVIEIYDETANLYPGTYYCDSIGFKEVDFNINEVLPDENRCYRSMPILRKRD